MGAATCGLMVPWVVGACVTPADGSPNIVGGAEFVLQNSVRAGVSTGMHYCGGPQMTLQGGFSSWWFPHWQSDDSIYVIAPLVLTGLVVWGY